MKGFLTCLAALGWIGLVIYQMSPRRQPVDQPLWERVAAAAKVETRIAAAAEAEKATNGSH